MTSIEIKKGPGLWVTAAFDDDVVIDALLQALAEEHPDLGLIPWERVNLTDGVMDGGPRVRLEWYVPKK